MDEIISFAGKGYTFTDVFVIIGFLIAFVRCIERFGKWCAEHLKAYYKKKRGIEEKDDTIATHTKEIKNLVERMDRMVSAVDSHYTLLLQKMDDQETRLEQIDADGKKRDCSILRDRLVSGLRYFGQNKDENGKVHISMGDHENLSHMFEEYFNAGGNGTMKQRFKNEFKHYIIDDQKYN